MLREGRNKTKTKKTIRKTPLLQRTEWGDPRYWPPDTQDGQCLWSTSSFLFFITWTKKGEISCGFLSNFQNSSHLPAETSRNLKRELFLLQFSPYSFEFVSCSLFFTCVIMGENFPALALCSNGLLYSLFEDEDDETPVLRGSSPL